MTQIDIVGGVYGERCAFPVWDQILGSSGRAALALSESGHSIRLHTLLTEDAEKKFSPIAESWGVQLEVKKGDQFVGFDYLHCLSSPTILPSPEHILEQPPLVVQGDLVIAFGMMETVAQVDADICVYDPQSPLAPKLFSETGSKAWRLAIVANSAEITKMAGGGDAPHILKLLEDEKAEVVVMKDSLHGAKVFDRTGLVGTVPAFKAKSVFTIGSGDVFVAAFAIAWAVEERSLLEATDYASRAVSAYVESSALPMIKFEDAVAQRREPIALKGGNIYLAGPFREVGQRILINEARSILTSLGMSVFSPVHDIGHGPAFKVVGKDLDAIRQCDVMLAVLNGSSPGTLFEVGFARALEKPVFCIAQNMRDVDLKLPVGSGSEVHSDFVSAIFQVALRE